MKTSSRRTTFRLSEHILAFVRGGGRKGVSSRARPPVHTMHATRVTHAPWRIWRGESGKEVAAAALPACRTAFRRSADAVWEHTTRTRRSLDVNLCLNVNEAASTASCLEHNPHSHRKLPSFSLVYSFLLTKTSKLQNGK